MRSAWCWVACLAAGLAAAQDTPAPTSPAPDGRAKLLALLAQPYKQVLEGSARDAERYLTLANRLRTRLADLRQRRVEPTQWPVLQRSAWLAQVLGEAHQRVHAALRGGDQGAARAAMGHLLFLEQEARRLELGELQRDWLTFQEVELLERQGVKPRRGEAGVLPYARAQWQGATPASPGGSR